MHLTRGAARRPSFAFAGVARNTHKRRETEGQVRVCESSSMV